MPIAPHLQVRRDLLAWYVEHHRRLPWRHEADEAANAAPDPYAVWVSEIMLQQTRVETATPYFERWMARFPHLNSLAAASLDEVLGLWQGLGYYNRARNLHKAAQQVKNDLDGDIPRDATGLRKLPGIGAYAAGAIASIAYGQTVPAIDGNVRRVLSRLDALDGDPARGATAKAIHARASALVTASKPDSGSVFHAGDLNQALMELGATICKPRNPSCDACPLRAHCLAFAQGRQSELPTPSPKTAQREARWLALALQDEEGRWLVARRPETGLLSGLWEFPMLPANKDADPEATLKQIFRLTQPIELRAVAPVLHIFTHIRLTAEPYVGSVSSRQEPVPDVTFPAAEAASTRLAAAYREFRWASLEDIGSDAVPTSTLMNKLVAAVQDTPPPRD